MSDVDVAPQISRQVLAEDVVEFDLVNGVFTGNAALLISKSYSVSPQIISPQVIEGSEIPARVDAFYIYYYDNDLEWMYSVDASGNIRFVYTFCKTNQLAEYQTEADAAGYREAC